MRPRSMRWYPWISALSLLPIAAASSCGTSSSAEPPLTTSAAGSAGASAGSGPGAGGAEPQDDGGTPTGAGHGGAQAGTGGAPMAAGGKGGQAGTGGAGAPAGAGGQGESRDAGIPDDAGDASMTGDAGSPMDAGAMGDGGAGDAGTPDLCSSPATTPAGYQSIQDFKATIHGDGKQLDGPALQMIVSANPSAKLCFPAGEYLLDNSDSATGLNFSGFSGAVMMSSSARFVCNTATIAAGQCLNIEKSSHVSFEGVTVTYSDAASLPLPRSQCSPDNAILVVQSSSVSFSNTTILSSPGVGIWVTDSTDVSFEHAYVTTTSADGLHFENTLNVVVDDYTSQGTGDDGLADTCRAQTDPNCGFTATNIHIHDSLARGIVVVGGCNASISHFDITGTMKPGISTSQDLSIQSRRSSMVNFSDGQITGGTYCGEIAASDGVVYDTLTCASSSDDGFFVYSDATNATIQNTTVTGAGNNGFDVAGSSMVELTNDAVHGSVSGGFAVKASSGVTLSGDTTANAGGYGFYHSMSQDVTEQSLVAHDVAQQGGNNRAWWAEDMTGAITADGLQVIDDQAKATGYIVGDYDDGTNPVTVSGITFEIAHGSSSIQPGGPASTYTPAP